MTVATNVALELDAFTPEVLKPLSVNVTVYTPAKIHDAVLTGAVGDDGSRFLDERRARRFHGHAGQHRAGRVFDDARDRCLRVGDRRHTQNHTEDHDAPW